MAENTECNKRGKLGLWDFLGILVIWSAAIVIIYIGLQAEVMDGVETFFMIIVIAVFGGITTEEIIK